MQKKHYVMISMCITCAIMMSGIGYHLFGKEGSWPYLPQMAFLAGLISPLPFWWFIISRNNQKDWVMGGVAGAISGLLFYYLFWLFYLIFGNICLHCLDGCNGAFTSPVIGPLDTFWASAVYAVWGIIFTGIYTIPIFTITGITILLISNKLEHKKPEHPL